MPERKPKVPTTKTAHGTKAFWMAVLIGSMTLALFWGGTRCDFVNLDDDMYVHGNANTTGGLAFKALAYAFTTKEGGSWMPLTWLSYLFDATVWGNTASGYHATNIILHALTASLLFLSLRLMTQEFWPSAFVAAFFAAHPLRLESVIWIAERKDVLSGVFFVLTLLAYARYAARPCKARMAATLGCLLLGLMAKPMLVTTPALLLLLDVWPLHRFGKRWGQMKPRLWGVIMEKLPLILVCSIFAGVTLLTQSESGAMDVAVESVRWRGLRIADNFGFYLGKIFWPENLDVLYPVAELSPGLAVGTLILILAISLAILRGTENRPWLTVGWFWFLISLLPVIGMVPVGSTWVADRYTYLPSVGIGVMLAWAAKDVISKFRWGPVAAGLASLLILTALASVTVNNLPRWQDSYTLFSDAVRKGDHPGAHQNLGVALAARGDYESAIAHFTRVIELNPDSAEAHYNRANAWQSRGETERALVDYSRAVELKPAHAEAYNNRGSLHAACGQFDPAIRDFAQAIALRADYTDALANRGRAYLETGRYREAVADYSMAIATKPDIASAYHDRAAAYYRLKEYDRAWADIRLSRRLGLASNPELIRRLETDSGQRD